MFTAARAVAVGCIGCGSARPAGFSGHAPTRGNRTFLTFRKLLRFPRFGVDRAGSGCLTSHMSEMKLTRKAIDALRIIDANTVAVNACRTYWIGHGVAWQMTEKLSTRGLIEWTSASGWNLTAVGREAMEGK